MIWGRGSVESLLKRHLLPLSFNDFDQAQPSLRNVNNDSAYIWIRQFTALPCGGKKVVSCIAIHLWFEVSEKGGRH